MGLPFLPSAPFPCLLPALYSPCLPCRRQNLALGSQAYPSAPMPRPSPYHSLLWTTPPPPAWNTHSQLHLSEFTLAFRAYTKYRLFHEAFLPACCPRNVIFLYSDLRAETDWHQLCPHPELGGLYPSRVGAPWVPRPRPALRELLQGGKVPQGPPGPTLEEGGQPTRGLVHTEGAGRQQGRLTWRKRTPVSVQ